MSGKDLLLPDNQTDGLASGMAAEQGQGQARRLLPVSQSHLWWAGLLPVPVYLVPDPQVTGATSESMLAGSLLGVQISRSLPRPLDETTSEMEQLELVIGLLPGPKLVCR